MLNLIVCQVLLLGHLRQAPGVAELQEHVIIIRVVENHLALADIFVLQLLVDVHLGLELLDVLLFLQLRLIGHLTCICDVCLHVFDLKHGSKAPLSQLVHHPELVPSLVADNRRYLSRVIG